MTARPEADLDGVCRRESRSMSATKILCGLIIVRRPPDRAARDLRDLGRDAVDSMEVPLNSINIQRLAICRADFARTCGNQHMPLIRLAVID